MKKLASIQYIRAAAALLVVLFHALAVRPWLYSPFPQVQFGAFGGDLFFVVSGFVIYASAEKAAPLDFMRNRIRRIAPAYWLATAVTAPFVILNHADKLDGQLGFHLLQSLAFVPHYSLEWPGQISPILVVGWTLDVEMFFYLLFCLALAVRRPIALTCIALALLTVAGAMLPGAVAPWRAYTNPVVLEFALGILLASMRDRLSQYRLGWLLPAGIGVFVLATAFGAPAPLRSGLPAGMIVAGAVSLDMRGRVPFFKSCSLLGDASYAIYLMQILTIGLVGAVVQRAPLHGPLQWLVMVVACMAASIAVGVLAHLKVEKPLLRRLVHLRPRREPAATALASPA